jgi:hypothetical protein
MVTLYRKPPNSFEEPETEKPSDAQRPRTMSKGVSPMTKVKSHFTGETASTRSASWSWGWLSVR